MHLIQKTTTGPWFIVISDDFRDLTFLSIYPTVHQSFGRSCFSMLFYEFKGATSTTWSHLCSAFDISKKKRSYSQPPQFNRSIALLHCCLSTPCLPHGIMCKQNCTGQVADFLVIGERTCMLQQHCHAKLHSNVSPYINFTNRSYNLITRPFSFLLQHLIFLKLPSRIMRFLPYFSSFFFSFV